MSDGPARIGGVGRALSRRAVRAGGYDKVPHQVSAVLEGLGKSHLEPTWRNATRKLWRLQAEQDRRGGVRPGDFKHRLRPDRHPKTVERHLRELDALGMLERSPVKGCPRRGPGTRVRYWLTHAINLQPAAAVRLQGAGQGPPPPTAAAAADVDDRGPPPDPDGPQSAREALERAKANLTT